MILNDFSVFVNTKLSQFAVSIYNNFNFRFKSNYSNFSNSSFSSPSDDRTKTSACHCAKSAGNYSNFSNSSFSSTSDDRTKTSACHCAKSAGNYSNFSNSSNLPVNTQIKALTKSKLHGIMKS